MKLADRKISVVVGDDFTCLRVTFYPSDPDGGLPATFYADMDDENVSRTLFTEFTVSDAYLLAMMLNEALGLEVKG